MLDEANADDEDGVEAAQKCLEVANIYERYEQAKANHKAVDFGDLIMHPTLLIEDDAALRAAVQLRHRHVLVDEYQDVNRASVRMVKALAGDGKRRGSPRRPSIDLPVPWCPPTVASVALRPWGSYPARKD